MPETVYIREAIPTRDGGVGGGGGGEGEGGRKPARPGLELNAIGALTNN